MFLQLALFLLLAVAHSGVDANGCRVRHRDLVKANKHWWDGSFTVPFIKKWFKILKPGKLKTKKAMVEICFKPKNKKDCYIVHNLCWKAIGASGCSSSISCGTPSLHDQASSKASGCMSASCGMDKRVCFKCWNANPGKTMKIKLTHCDIWASS